MLVRLISSNLAPVLTGSSLDFKRFRTKFTLVVRFKCFFRFFFQPIHLHGAVSYTHLDVYKRQVVDKMQKLEEQLKFFYDKYYGKLSADK